MAHVGSLASAPVRGEDGASPLFSVIVPTRRRPALLPVALRSVLSQDFTDFEVIVVDDDPAGGAEATVAALTDGRVRYLRNDRTPGAAGARNTGAAAARAPYLAFLDDDDAFAPGNLARHHAALQHVAQDTVLLFGGWQRYDFDADRPIKTICDRHGGWLFEEQMQCNYVSNIGTVVVPKRVFDEVGGFDESFVALEDVDLYLRLAAPRPVRVPAGGPGVSARGRHGPHIARSPARVARVPPPLPAARAGVPRPPAGPPSPSLAHLPGGGRRTRARRGGTVPALGPRRDRARSAQRPPARPRGAAPVAQGHRARVAAEAHRPSGLIPGGDPSGSSRRHERAVHSVARDGPTGPSTRRRRVRSCSSPVRA